MYVTTADYRSEAAAEVFCRSLKETGFAVLSHHPIDPSLIFEIYAEWQHYFDSALKHQDRFDIETQDGYFPFRSENAKDHPVKDLKEFFHVYPWGRYPSGMSEKTRTLYQQLSQLAQGLLAWIEAATPAKVRAQLSMSLSEMAKGCPRTLLRVIHYPPLSGTEESGAIRAAAHEDINLITLLPAATASGLEVQDMAGNWHEVSCDPGNIVVNVGDMLQLCTQGYYRSTTHRVTNPEGDAAKGARLSMPLFLHANDEVVLSPTHTAQSYLFERLRELGLK